MKSFPPRSFYLFVFTTCLIFTLNHSLKAQCTTGETQVTVSINTDNYPAETTWELKNWTTGEVYATGGSYSTANSNYTDNACIPDNATVGFTIFDVYGDGICCGFGNGSYSVSDASNTYASGGNFASEETSLFIIEPFDKDLAIVNLSMPSMLLANTDHSITGRIINLGTTFINSFDLNWQANDGMIYTQTYNIPFPSKGVTTFTHETQWTPPPGVHTLKVWASNLNGSSDDNPGNDILETSFNVLMQVPIRTVLSEHFTNASCPPCAAQNPAFDALMDANIDQVAPIKYHTSWPGFDPMYQENSADANARVSYYGIGGVPRVVLDGGQYTGAPSGANQGTIDVLSNISSGIIITVDETKTGNTVNIEAEIEALIPINSSSLRVHIVAVEKEVNYSSSPGSNGEKDFPYVMRKMLPSSNGTTIASMSANSTSTVNVSYTLPNFVDANEMRTIVFVQDHSTGFVYQSFLAPQIMGQNEEEQSPTLNAPETITCAISMDIEQVNATCGQSNGTATTTVTGGTAPLTYLWNNGADSPSLSNMAAGVYQVIVTDDNDCSVSETITITNTEPPALQTIDQQPTCGEANGSINAVVSDGTGTAPFTYQWSVAGAGNTPNVDELLPGTYVLIVTDDAGCTDMQSIMLEDVGAPTAQLTGIEPSCNDSGSVSATIEGGTAPYELQWNTGETSENIEITESGEYILLVTDAKGCTHTQSIEIDANTDLPSIEVSTQKVCLGELTSATANITGGTAPYQIEWSNGQSGETAEDLEANTIYEIEVTDANGCKTSANFNIEIFAIIEALNFATEDASCNESNGSLTAMVMGGTPPFSYDWSTDETGSEIENLAAGTYSLVVTDANGCTAMNTVEIQDAGAPNITLSATAPNCNEEGTIAANVSGGTPPYSYDWSTDETGENIQISEGGNYILEVTDASGCKSMENIEVEANTDLPSIEVTTDQPCGDGVGSASASISGGTPPYTIEWGNGDTGENASDLATSVFYNVMVTDANGCSESRTFTVEPLAGIENLEANSVEATCGLENGSISLQVVGGTPPYSYDWDTGETSAMIEDLAGGIYSVMVTDANGCSIMRAVEVEASDSPTIDIQAENAKCNEENGRAVASIAGGTPPYSINWDTGETSETIEDLAAGTYVLTIVDANDCEATQSVVIEAEDAPDASFFVPFEFCVEDGEMVMTALQTAGGTFAVNGEPIEGNLWTPESTGTVTVSYTVTENGCTSMEEQSVEIIDVFDAEWTTASGEFHICQSDLPLTIVANNTSGHWLVDNGAEILITVDDEGNKLITFDAEIDATNFGSFSVTHEGGGENCGSAFTKVINVSHIPQAPEVSVDAFDVCGAENAPRLELEGFPEFCNCPVTFNIYDGMGNLLIEGDTFNDDVFDSEPFINEAGVHVFEVATVNGECESNRTSISLEVYPAVAANLNAEPSCDNESGEVVATVLSGTAPYTFEWNNGATTGIVAELPPATYEVLVTDANGCTLEEQVELPELFVPTLDLGEDIVLDEGQTVVLEAGNWEGATYLWSTSETSSSIVISDPGTYQLTITTADGCVVTDEIEVSFSTDIEHIEGLNAWNLYPNPAKNQLILQFDLQKEMPLRLEIYDVTGQLYFADNLQLKPNENSFAVNVEAYPIGVYMVVLMDESGVVAKKMIKE